MNLPQFSLNPRVIITLSILSILLIGAGGFSLFFGSKDSAPSTPAEANSEQQTVSVIPENPVSAIQPLIQDCLFVYFHGCVRQISQNLLNQDNRYEDFAATDINYLLSYNQESTLLSYSEVVKPEFLALYFPEKVSSTSAQIEQKLSASQIVERVSLKENVNPRILLTLMEVVREGKGAVLTSRNPQTAFSDGNLGFSDQLAAVAHDLNASSQKYEMNRLDGKNLPTQLKFFDKTYQISDQTNPETLALVEVLAKYLKGKGPFERAVVVEESGEAPANNFVGLYKKLFQIDPTTNNEIPAK